MNGATQTSGRLPKPASRAPASTIAASTRCGATLTLATRSPRRDDLAIEDREHLERIDPVEPLEIGDPDVEHAVGCGDQVDPALGRAADVRPGPATAAASRSAASSSWSSPASGHEDRDRPARLRGGRGASRSSGGQPPALGPARAATVRSRGEDCPDQARGRAPPGVTRSTRTLGRSPGGQPSRARAASIARRV